MALADEILIRLEVNSAKAERNLQTVSKSLDRVASEATEAIRPMDLLEDRFDEVGMAAYNAKLRVTDFNKPLGMIPPIAGGAGKGADNTGKALGGLGRNAGMAGIQLQQFVGQLQGGVNPMIALSQQGADLGFVLGAPLLGAIIGIGASLAGVLLPSLFGAKEGFAELDKQIAKSKKEFEELGAATQQALVRSVQIQIEDQKNAIQSLNREVNLLTENNKVLATTSLGIQVELEGENELTQKQKDQLLLLNAEREEAVSKLGELETKLAEYLGLIPRETAETEAARTAMEGFVSSIQAQINAFGKSKAELIQQEALKHNLSNADQMLVDVLVELIEKQEADTEARRRAIQANKDYLEGIRIIEEAEKKRQRELDAAKAAVDRYNESQDRQAQALRESLDPWARYDRILAANKVLLDEGRISTDEYTEAQQRLVEQVKGTIEAEEKAKETDKSLHDQYKATMMTTDQLAMRGLKGMEDALVGVVNGSMSAKDAFKAMALSMINDMIRMAMQKMILNSVGMLFGFGSGSGGGFGGGSTNNFAHGNDMVSFAGGGYTGVHAKQMRSFAGGGSTGYGSRSGGIDNKGGFPAILHPNETVVDHNKGQAVGDNITVNVNVSTGVAQTVRAEVIQMLPMIQNSTKNAILDARRRGGSFAATFGA